MLRSLTSICLIGVVATLHASPVEAKDYRFRLFLEGVLNGVQFKEGVYTLKLESEGNPHPKAKILRNGKLLTEAPVQVRARAGERANTVMQDADGTLREIRLKSQVIIFVKEER